MADPKKKLTIAEALELLVPAEHRSEYQSLASKHRAPEYLTVIDAPPTKRDLERQRFYELDRPAREELHRLLAMGEFLAEAVTATQGAVLVPVESWRTLEFDDYEGTATDGDTTLRGLRVWPRTAAWSTARANRQCRELIASRAAAGYRPSKKELRDEALNLISGLSGRGFDAAWAEVAPHEWRKPGRRSEE